MKDVRGYEEKNPDTMRAVTSGYPRFVVHPYARKLAEHLIAKTPMLADSTVWLTSSAKMATALAAHLGAGAHKHSFAGEAVHGVSHPKDPAIASRAKTYLQNIGGFLSSREAEDQLIRLGQQQSRHPETVFNGDPAAEIRRVLRGAFPDASDRDILLAPSGMNAIYAAFQASAELQAARGRTVWLQLGWLYLDTIAILKKFTSAPTDYVYIRDPLDFEAIKRIFDRHGTKIAGILAEVPTNPLIQTPDIPALSHLCRQWGAHLIVDPTVASAFNVDVLKHSTMVVTSLTKYTASEGDVIAGCVVINPNGFAATDLRTRVTAALEPVYPRDLARLAAEIGETEAVLAKIHANVERVAMFLSQHKSVRDVYWALQPDSKENYRAIARAPNAAGGMISFTLKTAMEPFYDRLKLPKGPSFGMKTTLICPFMYLAHYDLVTTPAGLAELAASRLDPDLLRLCIGTEPADEIIIALAEALG